MKTLCVYCGSRPGARDEYVVAAAAFGELLASRGIRIVCGGSQAGVMGALSDGALAVGGHVVGVVPRALSGPDNHTGLTELRVVESMHERKAVMAGLADAFVALPGGYGTLEELLETLTWLQVGLHGKPCGLLDVRGYYGPLLQMFDHAVSEGFLDPRQRALLLRERTPRALLDRLLAAHDARAAQ